MVLNVSSCHTSYIRRETATKEDKKRLAGYSTLIWGDTYASQAVSL